MCVVTSCHRKKLNCLGREKVVREDVHSSIVITKVGRKEGRKVGR